MAEDSRNRDLADLLEDYHRRRALGETTSAEDYREAAGARFAEFQEILAAEEALDEAMTPAGMPTFPIPFGEYTLLSELGRGAVGVVYEAIHRDLGRKVALKILKTGFDTHPTAIERFRREARACAQLRHDNIVEIYEAGEHEGRHFYAMALLTGKTLGQLARDGELSDPRTFAAGVADVLDALHVLHESGIVHRDIKPNNIMVEPSGRMILADFGLARTVTAEALTQTGEHLGTPLYMSPEQLLGANDEVNARSDIYGVGATMYEVLAGRPVFQTRDLSVLMRMVLKDRPTPLSDAASHVPGDLSRIVMKSLEKHNADRYTSAAAMRDDLRAFAQGEPVTGRPLNALERCIRAAGRHKRPLLAVAAVVVAVVLGLALRPPTPAVLKVASVPEAEVELDGEPRGRTPLTLKVPPGDHELVLRREGWEERRLPLRLRAGQDRSIEPLLMPEDPTDPDAIAKLAAAFDLQMETWAKLEASRGGLDDKKIHILLPRGKVRMGDLGTYRLQVGPAFQGTGALAFRVNGKEVYRREVGDGWPKKLKVNEPLPAAVKSALKNGSRVSWGFYPEQGPSVTARFNVVKVDLERRMQSIHKRLGTSKPLVARQLVAQLYLSKGLAYAAYAEARAVVEQAAKAEQALAIMKAALAKMKLKDSPLWNELHGRGAGLPRRKTKSREARGDAR
ncbi:MAG: serine/threonine-protein kinase [Planctomycetota bacterium]|jgi:predicted Ser/Thr protein kinase